MKISIDFFIVGFTGEITNHVAQMIVSKNEPFLLPREGEFISFDNKNGDGSLITVEVRKIIYETEAKIKGGISVLKNIKVFCSVCSEGK